eukprot:m.318710 g.318710  ORF g.318710 m.318710 type:complete len:58 (+) comp57280_c0_seq1:27-200(+)
MSDMAANLAALQRARPISITETDSRPTSPAMRSVLSATVTSPHFNLLDVEYEEDTAL